MTKWVLVGVLAAATVAGTAPVSAQSSTQPQTTSGARQSRMAKNGVSKTDTAFLNKAAEGGQAEVTLATLAEGKASNPQVKSLAETIRKDHEQANAELQTLAQSKDLALSTSMSKDDQKLQEKLSQLSGNAFDKAYTDAMVKDHQTDIKEFEKHQSDSDPDVAAWVNKVLPKLRDHLQKAQDAQRAVGGK